MNARRFAAADGHASRATIGAFAAEGVHVAQLRYDDSSATVMALQREVALPERLGRAVPRRQAEFLAGRRCADVALRAAGLATPPPIAIGEHGAPRWPNGFTGSITHCQGWAMCAVGRSDRYDGIGIDLEACMSPGLARSIGREVATAAEQALLARQPLAPERLLTVLFSAKESLFKALYPSIRRPIDFTDIQAAAIDLAGGVLEFRARTPLSARHPPGASFTVAFDWHDGYVLTRCLRECA